MKISQDFILDQISFFFRVIDIGSILICLYQLLYCGIGYGNNVLFQVLM